MNILKMQYPGEGSFGEEAGLKGAQFIQDIAQYFQEGWSSADYDTMIDLFASGAGSNYV